MRTPSASLYEWHTRALTHFAAVGSLRGFAGIHEDEPHPGWYRRRIASRGAWLPASVSVEQPIDPETGELLGDEVWRCEVAGEARDLAEEWTWLAGQPISHEAYMSMLAQMMETVE
jgi:hypothetical protein